MSHSEQISNLVVWGPILASLAVWFAVAERWLRGLAALPLEPREPCPWAGPAVAFAIPLSIFVQLVVFMSSPQAELASLETVRNACTAMALTAALLMGLLAFGAPIRASDFGLSLEKVPGDVALGIGGFLAALAPVVAVSELVNRLGLRAEGEVHPFFEVLKQSPGWSTVGWMILAVVVLAPLSEELLYRVILQGWLESRMSPRAAVLFVAILFSAVHSDTGRPDALPLLPLALVLGYVYRRRHSYLAVVIVHALFNALNLVMALLIEESK